MVMAKIPKRGSSGSNKIPIEIKGFSGINKSHTRKNSQSSIGKNFYTKNGALFTRPGLVEISDPPSVTAPIYSIHSCKQAQLTERLIVQSGSELHHRTDELNPWALLASSVSGYAYGNVWRDQLILSFGAKVLDYSIDTASASDLRGGATDMPGCLFTATWEDYLWTIPGPNWAPAYKTQFNGYQYEPVDPEVPDGEQRIVDRDIIEWPEEYNVPMSDGTSLMAAFPFGSSLFCITGASTWHIYGNNEDDFKVHQGSRVGAYENGEFCPAALVADMPMWLGNDHKIYRYTGSVVEPISQPIDDLLEEEFAVVGLIPRVYSLDNKFWLFALRNILITDADEETTNCYVYDPAEREWYLYVFAGHILSAGIYDGKIHLGTKAGKVLVMDDTVITDDSADVSTSLTLSPLNMQGRDINAKTLHLTADPKNDIDIAVYSSVDGEDEVYQGTVSFEEGVLSTQDIRVSAKGKNISLRLESTDRVDELQSATLTVVPKRLK